VGDAVSVADGVGEAVRVEVKVGVQVQVEVGVGVGVLVLVGVGGLTTTTDPITGAPVKIAGWPLFLFTPVKSVFAVTPI